jgi:hypothetical protein
MMKIEDFFQSKIFKWITLGVACFLILAFVFGVGVFVGAKRADFSFRWAEEYHRNFAGPEGGFFGNIMDTKNGFIDANGCIGQIININGQKLTIKGKDNVEKIVLVSDKTTIIFQRKDLKLSELKADDNIIIMGRPNDQGQIEADFIRVMPSIGPAGPRINGEISPL